MTIMNIGNYYSKIDSERFGINIARVDDFGKDPGYLISQLKKLDTQLIISKINTAEISLIHFLESEGFRLMDTQVTYRFKIGQENEIPCFEPSPNIEIRAFETNDLDSISEILSPSFMNYGHYFADKRLDNEKCREIYTDWGRRSCLDKNVADIVFVAVFKSKLAGMLSFKKFIIGGNYYAAGGLGAVLPDYRGKNIFKMLAIQGLSWGLTENLSWVEHNVLTTNYPVNKVFSSLGFNISNSFITMHCWL